MTEFVAILLALVLTFAQLGTPTDLPPTSQDQVSSRGQEVADLARNRNPSQDNSQSDNSLTQETTNESSQEGINQNRQDDTPQSQGQTLGTEKVESENNRSERQMPTTLPQVAVDHSPALDPTVSNEETTESTKSEAEQNTLSNENATFGQSIASTNPESAKSDGRALGASISTSTQDNNRRP